MQYFVAIVIIGVDWEVGYDIGMILRSKRKWDVGWGLCWTRAAPTHKVDWNKEDCCWFQSLCSHHWSDAAMTSIKDIVDIEDFQCWSWVICVCWENKTRVKLKLKPSWIKENDNLIPIQSGAIWREKGGWLLRGWMKLGMGWGDLRVENGLRTVGIYKKSEKRMNFDQECPKNVQLGPKLKLVIWLWIKFGPFGMFVGCFVEL